MVRSSCYVRTRPFLAGEKRPRKTIEKVDDTTVRVLTDAASGQSRDVAVAHAADFEFRNAAGEEETLYNKLKAELLFSGSNGDASSSSPSSGSIKASAKKRALLVHGAPNSGRTTFLFGEQGKSRR